MNNAIGILLVVLSIICILVQPKTKTPISNITTKIELGEKLFFDPILSANHSTSCASCHQPQFAYADNKMLSLGFENTPTKRNTPSVMNMASREIFFYDGRAATLEDQAIVPIEHPNEMNLPLEVAVKRIQEEAFYKEAFLGVYQSLPNASNIANALAEFQRSLESDGSSPYDQWVNDEDTLALSASAQRGREIFIADKFKCFDCHFGPDFTGDEFRNIGLYDGITLTDKGRFDITKDSSDLGKFKVPGLRNVGLTAPYMHNGMFATLEEVIDFYSNPYDFIKNPINLDTLMIEPLHLTDQEKRDLVNFLLSLTDKNIPNK